jgi:predicted ATP-grasp superfamily ATP-dependent carboligase
MSAVKPPAVVMNMFYTGVGIARSLGERGIPVIGLTGPRIFGNFTRYAKAVVAPDSRKEPDTLLAHLIRMGEQMRSRSVIFPTRDDDVIFLDRFRKQLEPYYSLAIPSSSAIATCLNKWETYQAALRANVASPTCWLIDTEEDTRRSMQQATFPCVLKPLSSHHWRQAQNWDIVGRRKAITISSPAELLAEYNVVAQADRRALLQELVPGGDDCLIVVACYLDRQSRWIAGFNTQKLLQDPEGFGTGCIVQTTDRRDLFAPTRRLLEQISFTGIAEVEYKWNRTSNTYQLIEINPRPWDQHRLGNTCGADLIYLSYCEHAGLPLPRVQVQASTCKWLADDVLLTAALQMLRRRDGRLRKVVGLMRGKRIYAIWSAKDPMPFLAYFCFRLVPQLFSAAVRRCRSRLAIRTSRNRVSEKSVL